LSSTEIEGTAQNVGGACDHPNVTAADLAPIFAALLGGGGLWLAVREIARQVGETKRTRIREEEETRRLTIIHVMPLPEDVSRPNASTTKQRKLDAA